MAPRQFSLTLLFLGALLWACAGGSGSSGFDLAENAAIQMAIDTQQCVDTDRLRICPADSALPLGADGRIETSLQDTATLPCVEVDPDGTCNLNVAFDPDGFPPGTTFRIASRTLEPESAWAIGPEPAPNTVPGAPDFSGSVGIDPGRAGTDRPEVQIAVLVFRTPPQYVPMEVDELGDSGADAAFVTPAGSIAPEPAR